MDEENLNNVPEDGEEFDDDRVVLTDEDGVENEFKFLDVVEVDGKEYVILLPVEKLEDGEVVVFRIEGEGDDETFVGVDSAEEASKVFEIFKERAKDEYNFED
ncbi:MAG: DUF1292 domain-containing protein [Clostridia bacterium]|nr:DUF1292 domain-containing protein [Clostridia bacterium]